MSNETCVESYAHLTNAVMEIPNSLLQAAKRRARGYRLHKTFITMAYLINRGPTGMGIGNASTVSRRCFLAQLGSFKNGKQGMERRP
jgi:hypothetical protein